MTGQAMEKTIRHHADVFIIMAEITIRRLNAA